MANTNDKTIICPSCGFKNTAPLPNNRCVSCGAKVEEGGGIALADNQSRYQQQTFNLTWFGIAIGVIEAGGGSASPVQLVDTDRAASA